jgi:hypothetical protein
MPTRTPEIAAHFQALETLARSGRIHWKTVPVAKHAGALRAFEGCTDIYIVLVTQANVAEFGVRCDGLLLVKGISNNPLKLPDKLADVLYHLAAAAQN